MVLRDGEDAGAADHDDVERDGPVPGGHGLVEDIDGVELVAADGAAFDKAVLLLLFDVFAFANLYEKDAGVFDGCGHSFDQVRLLPGQIPFDGVRSYGGRDSVCA